MDMDTLHIYVVEIEKNFDFCPIRIIRGRKEEDEQKKKQFESKNILCKWKIVIDIVSSRLSVVAFCLQMHENKNAKEKKLKQNREIFDGFTVKKKIF